MTLDIVLKFESAAESIQTRLTRMMGHIYCLFGLTFEHNLAWTIGSVNLPWFEGRQRDKASIVKQRLNEWFKGANVQPK